jgi:ABC-type nitrate/sulfonate/bicarbonate transport system permease component
VKVRGRGWVVPLALLITAEVIMRMNGTRSDVLAPPSDIAVAVWTALTDGTIAVQSSETLGSAAGGVVIGGGLGLAVGLWLGLSRIAARLSVVSVELFRPIPSVALIPVAMLVYGFGYRMEIAIVSFACFWPMLILSQAAVAGVEPRLLEVARILGMGRLQQIGRIVLPASLPRVFVAFRLVVGIAMVVAVTVEIAANPRGLGYGMILAQQNLRPELMFALLLWVGVLGWTINAGLLALQRGLFGRFARTT